MTIIKRIRGFFAGIFMVAVSLLYAAAPTEALPAITAVLSLALLLYGVKMMVFYFTLARHMTGGLAVLFRAVLIFDIGLFAFYLPDVPLIYVMIYLAAIHGFAGIAGVLKALEAKRLEAPSWKLNFFHGLVNAIMAVLCLVFSKSIRTAVLIYSSGLFYSGVIRIIQAFRKTASIYVQ